MKIWLIMLISTLLMPLSMIIFGVLFRKKPPKKINYVYGYRSPMSVKNKDTWEFAHHYAGTLWYKWGLITLFVTIIVMLMTLGKDIELVGKVAVGIIILQSIPMIGIFIPTEMALRKHFDKDGNRRHD